MALTLSSITSKLKFSSTDTLNSADRAYVNEFLRVTNDGHHHLTIDNDNDRSKNHTYDLQFHQKKEQILRQQRLLRQQQRHNCIWSMIVIHNHYNHNDHCYMVISTDKCTR
ncbi:hypothetical protein HUG17_9060 [Dermatophagoides farinae]|uniref:Uncharacterized protein n=1 Tax=Dermatophagoides farinae TaxID=6954 RepID=A0A9D4SDS0_DERFA|nr:hypothetical protein HUG17_9060 [Dermatophagoides farinae]